MTFPTGLVPLAPQTPAGVRVTKMSLDRRGLVTTEMHSDHFLGHLGRFKTVCLSVDSFSRMKESQHL